MAFGVVLMRWRSVRGSGFWTQHKVGLPAETYLLKGWKRVRWRRYFYRWGQANSEHRNLLGICCSTRIMLMISIVCAVGRRMSAKTTTVKSKKNKNFYALFKLMLYECMLSDFFVCYSFILTREKKKIYTFEGHSFLSRSAMRGWSYDGSLCCAVWSLCFFLQTNMLCTHGCRCSFAVVALVLLHWQSLTWHAKTKLWVSLGTGVIQGLDNR